MSIRNLDKIFEPHRVAVIGASDTPTSVGYTVLRNLVGSGFRGVVYPVNAKREAVQGIQAYKDIPSLPHAPDLAVICTPAPTVPAIVRQCGEAGTRGHGDHLGRLPRNRRGGPKLEELVRQEQRKFDGMRILGPNCLGLIVPGINLNASFAAATPAKGHIGFISQSGALCTSVLDWAMDEGIGFSYFVSVGNMLDVSMGDLIDYFGSATETRRSFCTSSRSARPASSCRRPGRSRGPSRSWPTRRGGSPNRPRRRPRTPAAMAGVDAVYEAAFQRAGIERIFQIEDMFDCAELLARQQPPKGDRLAIITNAGGPGVMTTDALIARNGKLAKLSDETMSKLNELLPACWSHGNPVDVLGDAPPDRFAKAVEIVLKDKNVDAVLVILTPQAMTDPTATAEAVGKVAAHAHKPVLAAWMGGRVVAEGIQLLNTAGIPTYNTPEKAVRAFMHLVSYARNLEILHETPQGHPLGVHARPAAAPRRVRHDSDRGRRNPFRERLEGVPGGLRDSGHQAAGRPHGRRGRRGGPPARLSGGAEDPLAADHAQDRRGRRGVEPGMRRSGPRRRSSEITARAKQQRPDADIVGVTVQKMVTYPEQLRADHGFEERPGVRLGDHGGHGRRWPPRCSATARWACRR